MFFALPSGFHTSMKRNRFMRGGKMPPQSTSRSYDRLKTRPHSPHIQPYHQHYVAQQRGVRLLSNAYSFGTTKITPNIYEYELILELSSGRKDLPSHMFRSNYVTRSIRRLLMEELIPRLSMDGVLDDSIIIGVGLNSIFSLKRFSFDRLVGNQPEVIASKNEISFKNFSLNNDLFNQLNLDIKIRYRNSFKIDPTVKNEKFLNSILHHQLLLRLLKYGSVYYTPYEQCRQSFYENELDLISKHIMGISISGLRVSAGGQNLIVINCPHSYITRPHRLIDLLAAFIIGQRIPSLELLHDVDDSIIRLHQMPEISRIRGSEEWFTSFCSLLDGYKCKASAPDNNSCLRFSLTQEPASDLKLRDSISVQDYYKQLGINLNYPNLPCLKSKFGTNPYYPFELCSLLADQKVPIFRLSSRARNHMTILNKQRPDASKLSTTGARDEVEAISRASFNSYGMILSRDPLEAEGAILHKPNLKYQDQGFEPSRDFWESGVFYRPMHLNGNWCVVNTVEIDLRKEEKFFIDFSNYSERFGVNLGKPHTIEKLKQEILDQGDCIEAITDRCRRLTRGNLKFIMFVIDSTSTPLNRLIHLSFDDQPGLTATCIRKESILNLRQHGAIFRTLVHKLNTRLGGTNVTFDDCTLAKLSLCGDDLMIIGLDVTHPDNELSGVSIVGCAYTYSNDLFKHRSLVWPQTARVEIIARMDVLMERLLHEYHSENNNRLPKQIIVYRDGVSHEEFEKVRGIEIFKAQTVLEQVSKKTAQPKPILSYIIAQKRHTMRFFQVFPDNIISNPPSGTLIDQDIVTQNGREFYLYSNTNPQATARPLHYHVLLNGLGVDNLQKLTYFLCFNFGKCSGTLSMPSSLKYAHNAAYDARNRVIAAREFSENKFYTSKFFC